MTYAITQWPCLSMTISLLMERLRSIFYVATHDAAPNMICCHLKRNQRAVNHKSSVKLTMLGTGYTWGHNIDEASCVVSPSIDQIGLTYNSKPRIWADKISCRYFMTICYQMIPMGASILIRRTNLFQSKLNGRYVEVTVIRLTTTRMR